MLTDTNITGTKYEVKQGMCKEWNNVLSLHSASRIPPPKKYRNCVKSTLTWHWYSFDCGHMSRGTTA